MSPYEFKSLDIATASMMIRCITKVEASEMLNGIVVSNFPNLESDKKKSVIKSLQSQAEVKIQSVAPKSVSNEDVDVWLRGILGG